MWHKGAARYRLNKGCRIVLQALEQSQKLCSAQEICQWLKTNLPAEAPALTTVYRAIDSLLQLDLIQSVDIGDGEKRYESVEPGQHHHHLICLECLQSAHLEECFVESLMKKVEEVHRGFKVTSHVLELFGVCNACLQSKETAGSSSETEVDAAQRLQEIRPEFGNGSY